MGYDDDHPRVSRESVPAEGEPDVNTGSPEEEVQDGSGHEDVSEEIAKPMMMRDPGRLTAQEYDGRCAMGRLPWRSNCVSCVSGMGREDPHKKGKEKGALSELAYDYAYVNVKDEERVRRREKKPEDVTATHWEG